MKGPAATAIDRVVTEVIAPALKVRGFKRRGRLWTHGTEVAHRGLTVQRSQLNYVNSATFTLNVRFAFLALGHEPFVASRPSADAIAGPHARIGPYITGQDHWWEISDAGSGPTVDAFVRGFADDWDALVLPLLDAADDPRRFCTHLTRHGTLSGVFIAVDHAQQLEDSDLTTAALDRALQLARRLDPSPQRPEDRVNVVRGFRSAPSHLHRLYHAWNHISAMAERTGRQLDGADHERAVDALHWAAEIYLFSVEASSSETVGARAFGARLGLDPANLDLSPEGLRQRRARLEETITSQR